MKQILIATHGKMASGIRYTAEMIVGSSTEITTVDAYVNQEDDIEAKFRDYFNAHQKDRIFVFTDVMGGSVNQKLMGYAEADNVTLITGTNLPVLIQIMMADESVTNQEIEEYVESAKNELKILHLEKNKEQDKGTLEKNQIQNPHFYENSNAKIAALRIDDRLIHGQVAMTWTKQLKIQGILVANDDAANDNTQKMALKMAVPAGIRVLIRPVEEAVRVLNHPKAANLRILVLTRTVKDALRIREQVGEIEFLNLGNAGRFDGIDISEKTALSSTIMLTAEERECLKKLTELDPGICLQQVPNDEKKYVKDMLSKL